MLKFVVGFGVGLTLLVAAALGPSVFRPQRLSSVKATSVRVESIPKPRPRSSTVYVGGSSRSRSSSWGSSSSSGRYSSGGGFSSGK